MAKIPNSNYSSIINSTRRLMTSEKKHCRSAFTVSFSVRQANKLMKNTEGYIYMSLNYGKKRLSFSTGIKAIPVNFDALTLKIKNDSNSSTLLGVMKSKAEIFATDLRVTGRPIDLQLIKACVLDKHIETVPSLIECVKLFNQKIITLLYENGELEKGSYKKLQGWNNHIERWVVETIGRNSSVCDVVPAEANNLLLWLKSKHNLSHNVACRIVAHLKRILNYAVENEWIIRNPFMNFRKKLVKKKQDFLNEKEIDVLERTKFASIPLAQLRDMFLFQCYTSLSFNELKELTPDHISLVDGYHCIRIRRKKTDHNSNIEQIVPLVPQALELLEVYRTHPVSKQYNRCFPVQSNQKYNALLKQVGMITGISKRLTSHVGRRTAATHYLKHGVPLVSVSAMLGHATTEMTETHYAFRQPEMVVRDFHRFLSK